ncbi:extracellular solute-binding protein [Paenibacillus psychroresistens]|nr:extracellular solute-binding protein [Paenibacillus psychroresistens]
MKLKKTIIGCTIALLAFSAAGCTTKTATEETPANETASSTPAATTATTDATPQAAIDPLAKYDPPIEITAVKKISDGTKYLNGDSLESNVWSKAYEEALGIKIKYLWTAPQAQYEQKSNIAIATADLPDVMEVNVTQLKKMADDGQLEDLTDVYKQYAAPFTQEILASDGGNAIKSATFDGKLLALPQMGSGLGQTDVLWVRSDWLKKLNLPEPKTMADVLKISEAFTTQDPDGNSKADSFGLGMNKDVADGAGNYFAATEGFFNGYHAYPNIWVKDAAGKLVYGSTQPEMKTALGKLHELYAAGQIDKEFGTKDAGKVKEAANAGKLGMLYGYFWNIGAGWLQDGKVANSAAEWTPYAIPTIDGQPANAQVPFAITTYFVVKKGAKNPEAALKMLNLALEKNYGKTAEPEKFNVDKDGTAVFSYALLYGEAPRKNLDAYLHVTSALESKDASQLNAEEKGYYDNSLKFLAGDVNFYGNYKMYGPLGSLSVIDGYSKNKTLMDDQYFGAPTTTMTQSNSTLKKLQIEAFTSIIIRGKMEEFDQYVTKWKQLGGDKITEEVNTWFATQK